MNDELKPRYKQTEIGLLPEEWEAPSLAEIGFLIDGDWILKENYRDDGVRLLQVADIGVGKFLDKSKRFISLERARELKCTFVNPEEDILISRMPDPIGRACIAPNLSYPYIVAVDVTILKPDKSKVNLRYVVNVLNSSKVLKEVEKRAAGATRNRISRARLERIRIPLPPLAEQKKIAEVLSTVDEGIEKTEQAIAKTERLEKGLMQELFTRGIGHKEVRITRIGKLPSSWDVVKVKNVGHVSTGKTPSTLEHSYWNGQVPFITPADMENNKYVLDTGRHVTLKGVELAGGILPRDTVLVVCIGSTIGKTGMTAKDSVTNQQINAIRCNAKNDPHYIYYAITYRSRFLKSFSGIAAVPIINKTLLEQFEIPRPELPEQKKIAEILSTVDGRLELLRSRKEKLERIKKGLMNDLLTGKKRVKV